MKHFKLGNSTGRFGFLPTSPNEEQGQLPNKETNTRMPCAFIAFDHK